MRSILFLIIFFSLQLCGQQLNLTTNTNNPDLFNPAAWNTDILNYSFLPKHSLYSSYRTQWTGLDLGPKYISIHYDHYSHNNTIIGLSIIRDSYGPLSSTQIGAKYAYRFKISQKSYLSGGANVASQVSKYDPNVLTIREENDILAETPENTSGLTISPGLFFSSVQKNNVIINVGISYQNAVSLLFSDLNNIKPYPTLITHLSLIKFSNDSYRDASFYELASIYRNTLNLSDDLDISFKYQYRGLISLKSGIRMGFNNEFDLHAVHFNLGLPLTKTLKWNSRALDLNYALELPMGGINRGFGLTHELSLGFLF